MTTTYNTGTISVSNGSTTVTGVGTNWIAGGILPGDDFRAAGLTVEIASVNSATSITLARAWPGTGQSSANYSIRLIDAGERSLVALNQIVGALGSGNLISLAGLPGATNKMPYFTGVGAMALADLTPAARALLARTAIEQSSPSDATVGRLMAVGAFGLGPAITLGSGDNLDNILASGFYYNPTGGNTTGNNYPISSAGSLTVASRQASNTTQKFVSFAPNALASDVREFTRTRGLSGWSPWVEVFHQGRILGTVSQSGGVPTGAVIERGSNANGDYVRFADGTQICDHRITTTTIFGTSESGTWTFPAAFAATPECVATAQWVASGSGLGHRFNSGYGQ